MFGKSSQNDPNFVPCSLQSISRYPHALERIFPPPLEKKIINIIDYEPDVYAESVGEHEKGNSSIDSRQT